MDTAEVVLKVKQCVLGKVILKPEKVSEQDITVIVQDQKQKPDTGHVGNGNMRLSEITEDTITEAKMVWRKSGNSVKRAIRCTSGRRKGRIVANPSQCGKPIDFRKRLTMKKTKARLGARMARKARRTKRFNIQSKRVAALNKRR